MGLSPAQLASLIQGTVRGILMALAFGLGFAALAQRPGMELSLLQELAIAWRMRGGRHRDRDGFGNPRGPQIVDEKYIDAITASPEGPGQSGPPDPRRHPLP